MTNDDLNTCSNEKILFKYSDKWELDSIPLDTNPDCIATLTYLEDGSLLNVIAFPSELQSLEIFKEVVEDSLKDDGAQIVSSEIAYVNKRKSIQIHSLVFTEEINFEMYSIIFLEDHYLYIFELRTVSDIVSEFMDIVKTFEIID